MAATASEWPEESYPPWAHRQGYTISRNIRKEEVYRKHKRGELKVEDGLHEMKNDCFDVTYENDASISVEVCKDVHYNEPRRRILESKARKFCSQTMNHNVSFI